MKLEKAESRNERVKCVSCSTVEKNPISYKVRGISQPYDKYTFEDIKSDESYGAVQVCVCLFHLNYLSLKGLIVCCSCIVIFVCFIRRKKKYAIAVGRC